jgi:asparagine synthase (glutamine-hydrolysing)
LGSLAGVKIKYHPSTIKETLRKMLNSNILENGAEARVEVLEDIGIGLGFINRYIDSQDDYKIIRHDIESRTINVCIDGQIDNSEEICRILNITKSNEVTDNFLISLLYMEFKEHFPKYLKGQFAIVLFDERTRELFLVKDPLGLKQLFYCIDDTGLKWFTEISQLKHVSNPKVNMNYIQKYLVSQPEAYSETAFQQVYRVEAGQLVKITPDNSVHKIKYYRFPSKSLIYRKESEYIEHFHELFKSAIKRSIPEKQQEIGFSLSGGLDSSSILSYAYYYKFLNPSMINVFSYVFSNNLDADEREYIDEVLKQYPVANVNKIDCSDEWCFKGGLRNFEEFDEPYPLYGYSLSSIIPKALADKGMKVLISGHCGDHVLMGNLNYLYNLLSAFKLPSYAKQLTRWKKKHSILSLLFTYSRKPKKIYISTPVWLKNASVEGEMLQEGICWDDESRRKYFEGIVYQSGHEWVTQYVSKKYGIETRYPFMDIDLMEFLLNIPVQLKYNPKYDKYILKEAAKGILPEKIRYRKQKAGHSSLITKGIRKEWGDFQSYLQLERLEEAGLVDSKQFKKTVNNFYMGNIKYYSDIVPITRTLSAEVWLQNNQV